MDKLECSPHILVPLIYAVKKRMLLMATSVNEMYMAEDRGLR